MKTILELSLRRAIARADGFIGTEHLLLALTDDGDGVANQIMTQQGATDERIAAALLSVLADPTIRAASRRRPTSNTIGLDRVLAVAAELADDGLIGTRHVLAALARVPGTAAIGVLESSIVDRDAFDAALSAADDVPSGDAD